MKPLSLLVLLWISTSVFVSCKTEPLSYEEAIRQCKTGSGKFFNSRDTVLLYPTSPKCIMDTQLPKFTANFTDGRPVTEDYFKNKINVINFWFIGCHPCEAEIPGFNALVIKYKDQPVNFLAISRNQPEEIEAFIKVHPFNVDHIPRGALITSDIFHMSWGYPFTYVTDVNGRIIFAENTGGPDSIAIKKVLEELSPVIDGALKKI